jgi:hypothetical protein
MNGPVKAIILAVAMLALVGGAFWGGTAYQRAQVPGGPPAFGGAQGMPGGPMGDLTGEQQAEIESMSPEERQAWMEENRGDMPVGGPVRGGNLEGEVIEIAEDTITVSIESGSQTFYLDEDTVIAYVEGAGTLTAGSQVTVIAQPAADGVTTASLVVVL